jgi:hypothetical protein
MKILRLGIVPKPPAPRVFRGECPVCHCQIEVDDNDPALKVPCGTIMPDDYVLCPTKGCPQLRITVEEYITRKVD